MSDPVFPADQIAAPERCPACASPAIVTTTKHPDVDSYWRCTACGEMWNVSRRQPERPEVRRWW